MYYMTKMVSRCTPERIKKIQEFIANGASFTGACRAALINPSTAKEWLTQGELEYNAGIASEFNDFFCAVKLAEAELEHKLTKRWTTSLLEDENGWKGIESYLARRFKDEWGKTSLEIEASVTDLRKSPEFNAIVALILQYVPVENQEALARDLAAMDVRC